MTTLPPGKRIENTAKALELWALVPPEKVIPGLSRYQCGTLHCFGGHLMSWKHFKAQGLHNHYEQDSGAMLPCMIQSGASGGRIYGGYVAEELFGDADLFAIASPTEYTLDPATGLRCTTEHQIVTARLEKHLKRLKAQLAVVE